MKSVLTGPRFEISRGEPGYPVAFESLKKPPERLYGVGSPDALAEGIAIVGARKATPYGIGCAKRFAEIAARRGIVVISGGARGCDAAAHKAAISEGAPTVAFLGGGCDKLYPSEHAELFQRIVDGGGALVSEYAWDFDPRPYAFRERNRLIASLAKATLIVEAGLPSGTFSTADEALSANRDVLVVPGAITSRGSRGANRLIYQGATPVIDDETFEDQLFSLFGCLRSSVAHASEEEAPKRSADVLGDSLLAAISAEALTLEELLSIARSSCVCDDALTKLMVWLARAQSSGLIAQYPDGSYGPVVRRK